MSTRDIIPCVDCVYDPTLSRHGVRWSNNDTILHGIYSIGRRSLSSHAPHEAPHNPGCFTKMHYSDVIMSGMTSQIISVSIVYSIVCSGADQRKHQSSAALAFVRGIHRWPLHSRTKGQWRGKCYHLMTSSWNTVTGNMSDFICCRVSFCFGYMNSVLVTLGSIIFRLRFRFSEK